jgi:hypothetical protein
MKLMLLQLSFGTHRGTLDSQADLAMEKVKKRLSQEALGLRAEKDQVLVIISAGPTALRQKTSEFKISILMMLTSIQEIVPKNCQLL